MYCVNGESGSSLLIIYRLYDIIHEHVLSDLIRARKFSNFDMSGAIRGRKIICRAIIIIRNIIKLEAIIMVVYIATLKLLENANKNV